jgi:hypothetical protein
VAVKKLDLILSRVEQRFVVSLANRPTVGVAQSLGDSAELNTVAVTSSAPHYRYLFIYTCILKNIGREGVVGIWYFMIANKIDDLFPNAESSCRSV